MYSPEDLLPVEIWENIISRIESRKDVLSLYHAHPDFQNLLQGDKCRWMFELVNMHAFFIIFNIETASTLYLFLLFYKVIPHVLKHISDTKTVLNSRLVCKSWCHAITNMPYITKGDPNKHIVSTINGFPALRKFNQEMTRWKNEHRNPFPSKTFRLKENKFQLIPAGTVVKEFLPWIGAHISTFIYKSKCWMISTEFGSDQHVQYYISLCDCLKHFPNLEHLYLHNSLDGDGCHENFDVIAESFPLPSLPRLETLKLSGCHKGMDWKYVLKAYDLSLVTIEMDDMHWVYELNPDGKDQEFQFLKLTNFHMKDFHGNMSNLLKLMHAPVLEKLYVTYFYEDWDEDDKMSAVQQLYEICQKLPSLKNLKFLRKMSCSVENAAFFDGTFYAPKSLTVLHLLHSWNMSYSLLLRFPNLKHFYLHLACVQDSDLKHAKYCQKNQVEIIEIHKLIDLNSKRPDSYHCNVLDTGLKEVDSSSIWKLLPGLQLLTVVLCRCHDRKPILYRRSDV